MTDPQDDVETLEFPAPGEPRGVSIDRAISALVVFRGAVQRRPRVKMAFALVIIAVAIAVIIAMPAAAQTAAVYRLAPEMTIPSDAIRFTTIHSLLVAGNGNVIALGDDDFRGQVFGPDGKLIRNFARKGRGPGEVQTNIVFNAGLVADTLWIDDSSNRRIALFTVDGRPIRDIPYAQTADWRLLQPEWAGLNGNLRAKRLLPNNVAIGVPSGAMSEQARPARGSVPADGRVPLMRMQWDGRVIGSPLTLPIQFQWFSVRVGENSNQSFGQAFRHLPKYDFSADGKRIAIATVVDAATPFVQLLHLSTSGDTLGKFSLPFTPDPVTSRTVDSAVADWVKPRPAGLRPANFPPPPSLQGKESEIRDSLVVTKFFPPFQHLSVANDGTTWIDWRTPGTNRMWLVVSPRGEVLMRVDAGKAELRAFDGKPWGLTWNDDDLVSIVRFRLVPR